MILKTYKYRIYPKPKQYTIFAKHFGCTRFVYNWGLQLKINKYKTKNENLSCFDTINLMKQKKSELTWLKEVNSQSLQSALRHLDRAYTRFFRDKRDFPRFKSRHHKQSFACPQNVKVDFHNSTIRLPKIGEVKTVFERQFKGKIKTCTVSKTSTNKYFISILVETPEDPGLKPRVQSKTTIGIDLGIKEFAILSDKTRIENLKYLHKHEQRLKVLQRRASKKQKKSNNRRKAFLRVARKHEQIRNQRQDFLHKVSTKLIRENQTICLEDLNVAGMIKNHKLAKSIADVSWSTFVNFLKYKAEWYGVNLLQIGRFKASSKTCSICGLVNSQLELKHRKWKCLSCGTTHDRDVNAAVNIKQFALQNPLKHSGTGSPGELLESSALAGAVKEETPLL